MISARTPCTYFGATVSWSRRRPSWGRLGAILGPSWGHLGGILGASWGQLGASWGPLGAILGHLGAILGHLGASWGPLGGYLGLSSGILGPAGDLLGLSWAILGPVGDLPRFLGPSGVSRGFLRLPSASWGFLGLPGAFWRFLAWGRPGLQRVREPYETTCFFHMPTHGEPEEKRPAVRQPTESRHFHVTFQRQLAQSTPPRFPFHCQAGSARRAGAPAAA